MEAGLKGGSGPGVSARERQAGQEERADTEPVADPLETQLHEKPPGS